MSPSVDDLKLLRDGHLWAARYVRPEWPKQERDARGHTFVTLYEGAGCIEYVPKDCKCGCKKTSPSRGSHEC